MAHFWKRGQRTDTKKAFHTNHFAYRATETKRVNENKEGSKMHAWEVVVSF